MKLTELCDKLSCHKVTKGFLGLMDIRETMYHELIHGVLRYNAEEEVTWIAQRVNRRRMGWQYCRGSLRRCAVELNLGPVSRE